MTEKSDKQRLRELEARADRLEIALLEAKGLKFYAQPGARCPQWVVPQEGALAGVFRAVRNRYKRQQEEAK